MKLRRPHRLWTIAILSILAVAPNLAGRREELRPSIQSITDPESGQTRLLLRLQLDAAGPLPHRLRIEGKGHSIKQAGFSGGGVLGQIRVETASQGLLELVLELEDRKSPDGWPFQILSEETASLPLGSGRVRDSGQGLEIEMVAADWLIDLSQGFVLLERASVEIDLLLPLVGSLSGESAFTASASRITE